MTRWTAAPLLTALLALAISPARAEPSAKDLLAESGISGGVAVHVGCGDGKLTAALRTTDRLLVHGLDTDAADVAKAKAHIASLGVYGKVSAERYDGKNLPHGDSIVNLMVIEDASELTAAEVARALVPKGVALVKGDALKLASAGLARTGKAGGWTEYTKPWPKDIDEWTHFLYDASGNAVSTDSKVGHPRRLQWYAGPKHARHHDALASFSAMTSSDGRVFYIIDEGPISVVHHPPQWRLVARDAFNGKLLWKREIPTWMTHLYNFRAGPKQLPRRLVSIGSHVYATLDFTGPVVKLDGATGKTLMTFAGSAKAEELIYHDGKLLIVKGDPSILIDKSDGCHGYWELAEHEAPTVSKSIIAYDAKTGKKLWDLKGANLKHIAPLSLCARGGNVFYLDNSELHCLSLADGRQRWASSFATQGLFIRSYAPTVVARDDVIMILTWNRLHGFAVADGKRLWTNKGSIGFGSPGDLFVKDGKAWTYPMLKSIWRESKRDADGIVRTGISIPRTDFINEGKTGVAVDIRTGKVVDEMPFVRNQHHHRCYRNKATERYVLIGHSGIQPIDFKTKKGATNQWVRGICQYGIMPANGHIYVPPDPCQCYSSVQINGLFALAERNSMDDVEITSVLERGPAFGSNPKSALRQGSGQAIRSPQSGAWPTYRGNIGRSGSAACDVPAALTRKWAVKVGEGISAPVVAGDSVFVAEKDAYAVHCLARADGKPKWTFRANGPVDSPPTIGAGLCLFGSGDGSVYCLDAATGALAWRFKVSGIERRIGSENRLESPLAVSGSVLVVDDVVYFAAGRSSFLDGGIRVYGLAVRTGKQLHSRLVASGHWTEPVTPAVAPAPQPKARGKGKPKVRRPRPTGALVDILLSDGNTITMRQVRMNKTLTGGGAGGTITPITGLLDNTWFHRLDWKFGSAAGQLVVHDGKAAYSVVNPYTRLKHQRKSQYKKYKQDGHLHLKFTRFEEEFFPVGSKITASSATRRRDASGPSWTIEEAFQPRAMVLAGKSLCLAGRLDAIQIELKSGRAKSSSTAGALPAVLRIYSAKTGQRTAEHKLESDPVFDGAAAAYGHLFIALKNGKLVCMGK